MVYNIYNPEDSRVNVANPKMFGHDYENLFIHTVNDYVRIHFQLVKQPDSKKCPTLIYFHGNSGNVGHRLENALDFYKQFKLNLLMVEYRGFGLSEGHPTESGIYNDALTAIRIVEDNPDLDGSNIYLFGRSLGGGVVIGLVYLIQTQKLRYSLPKILILENTFTCIPEISRHLFRVDYYKNKPLKFLSKFVPDFLYKSRFNSIKKIPFIKIPTLFISGLADEMIPPTMMQELFNVSLIKLNNILFIYQTFKASGSPLKEIKKFPGGIHCDTWKCPGYYDAIREYLNKIANQPASSSVTATETFTDGDKGSSKSCTTKQSTNTISQKTKKVPNALPSSSSSSKTSKNITKSQFSSLKVMKI